MEGGEGTGAKEVHPGWGWNWANESEDARRRSRGDGLQRTIT